MNVFFTARIADNYSYTYSGSLSPMRGVAKRHTQRLDSVMDAPTPCEPIVAPAVSTIFFFMHHGCKRAAATC